MSVIIDTPDKRITFGDGFWFGNADVGAGFYVEEKCANGPTQVTVSGCSIQAGDHPPLWRAPRFWWKTFRDFYRMARRAPSVSYGLIYEHFGSNDDSPSHELPNGHYEYVAFPCAEYEGQQP